MGGMPEGRLAPVMDTKSPTPAEGEYWRRDRAFSKSRKLELEETRANLSPLTIPWDLGKDACFPTVCEIGIQGNYS